MLDKEEYMSLEINLSGKVALVTGAGRGIGRAIAVSLAKAGADVCVTARTEAQIHQTAELIRSQGRKALAVAADAAVEPSVESVVNKTIAELQGLHILINNAGILLGKPLLKTSATEYKRVMDTNVMSMFHFTRAVGPHFIENNFGRIVNMASVGAYVAAPNQSIYHTSKGAIAMLTKSMAIEWARYNILINAVAPGYIDTEIIAHISKDESKLSKHLQAIPLRRLGKVEEVAHLVAFLCSDLASYMTGSVVVADGGLMIP
jgi:NAD(P)-dependent dehydrogenase (short-subunit alcohol dehydrogenase family)